MLINGKDFRKHIRYIVFGFDFPNFNLVRFYQILSESEDMRANIFNSIGFNKSHIHLINACHVIFKYNSGFELINEFTLFCQNPLHCP
jgi:hypothetical protein